KIDSNVTSVERDSDLFFKTSKGDLARRLQQCCDQVNVALRKNKRSQKCAFLHMEKIQK
uniref:Uncharacterized protein n=1 Tax=Lepisosteus oculatus TaxID=7918 RepID=W5M0C0_LEPOC